MKDLQPKERIKVLAVLKQALVAMDCARDAIQPITVAQIKLHRLNANTDTLLDSAALNVIELISQLESP